VKENQITVESVFKYLNQLNLLLLMMLGALINAIMLVKETPKEI